MINISLEQSIKEVRRDFLELSKEEINKSVVYAINHTILKSRTQAGRSIRGIYKVRGKDLSKSWNIEKATPDDVAAMLNAYNRPMPVSAFSPRQRKDGISIRIKNTRKVIKSAFFALGRRGGAGTSQGVAQLGTSGHRGVFARAEYSGNKLKFRDKRKRRTGPDVPITEVKTLSVPGAARELAVITALSHQMNKDFPVRLAHEFRRRLT